MYSLRRRLLISATLLLLLFLGAMGVALNGAFEKSVLSNAEDALRNQVLLLIANIDVIDNQVVVPSALPEPRLSQTDSSLFAQISIDGQGVVWRSPSLLDKTLPTLESDLGLFNFVDAVDWADNPAVYSTSLGVEWETQEGDFPFTVQVAEQSQAYLKRLSRYQRQIGLWLAILGGSLIVFLLALLGWALKPLNRVTTQVGQIEEGERQRFSEDYPLEVNRLTQNLNQLLNFEEQRITRHKEVLGNLAHSLKTPIAVLSGLKFGREVAPEAKRQLMAMQTIIDYQLQSASAVGRRRFAKPIEVYDVTQQIINSLNKLHADKSIRCDLKMAQDVQFFGDQGDWMELAGNLLDNAFKWTSSMITIEVKNIVDVIPESHRKALRIIVEDNGPGISADLKSTILQRGVRLDSQTPGHGLGLHIVKGIIEAYDGELDIQDSHLESGDSGNKGTRFIVLLK